MTRVEVAVNGREERGAPLVQHAVLQLPAHPSGLRETIAPLVGAGRVDYRARVDAPLVRMDRRVERTAPAAADDVDVALRVDARTHGPQHVLRVGDVDVVVD